MRHVVSTAKLWTVTMPVLRLAMSCSTVSVVGTAGEHDALPTLITR